MIYTDRIYGKHEIKDKLILDIIKTKEMQRLKGVNQYGSLKYLDPKWNTTRFEHCLGVYLLLKILNASREEQIAGLLHDIPHTAFSHDIDYVFNKHTSQEYHHDFHEKIVKNSEIAKILKKNNIDVDFILNEENFKLLERPIPDLCADRLDYLMRDAFVCSVIDLKTVKTFFDSFVVKNNEITINNLETAKEAAMVYIKMNATLWTNPLQSGIAQMFADAVKIAMDQGFVNEDDLFTTDDYLLNKLKNSNDKKILFKLSLLNKDSITEGTKQEHDLFIKSKLRYIDPKYIEDDKIKKLSENDEEFAQKLEKFKKTINNGFYIKINWGADNG